MPIPTVSLAGNQVGRVGFGLMQLTWVPNGIPDETTFACLRAAADAGATAWSSATFYGHSPGGGWDNIELLGRFFKKHPEYIGKVTLVIKGGLDVATRTPSNDLEANRKLLATIKEKMGANVPIDVYLPARIVRGVDPAEYFQPFEQLRKEGLFTALGASEVSAKTLKAVTAAGIKISVVEIEVSLWSYDKDIQNVIQWSTETKTPIFAYSPLGRGFLTRKFKSPDDIPAGSLQSHSPRFQGQAFYDNLKLVDVLDEIAAKKGINAAQLAIAWVLSLSPETIPIPGSANPERTAQNSDAGNIVLTKEEIGEIDAILSKFDPSGARYPPAFADMCMV